MDTNLKPHHIKPNWWPSNRYMDQSLAKSTSLHFLSAETFAALNKFSALQLEGSYKANMLIFKTKQLTFDVNIRLCTGKKIKPFTVNIITFLPL